jgi:hypothetical protein
MNVEEAGSFRDCVPSEELTLASSGASYGSEDVDVVSEPAW